GGGGVHLIARPLELVVHRGAQFGEPLVDVLQARPDVRGLRVGDGPPAGSAPGRGTGGARAGRRRARVTLGAHIVVLEMHKTPPTPKEGGDAPPVAGVTKLRRSGGTGEL